MTPTAEEVLESVRAVLGDAVEADSAERGEAAVTVAAGKWVAAAGKLKEAGFLMLSDLTGVDWLEREPRFEVVYNLTRFDPDDPVDSERLRVKVPVEDAEPPLVPSVTSVWPTANWHERETFDMFGIVFEGHPALSRILMPDEWEGHPLRKDYAVGKVPVEYKHISPGYTPGLQR
jgi:NADH-quinone oxidoreductase subunit C